MGNHEKNRGGAVGPEALEHGRLLFAQPCSFVMGAVSLSSLPETELAEVAFAGRSNVGKSSLVNALTGRRTLARTSNTPGRTQEINFFALGEPGREAIHLVDLPGYGYARASRNSIMQWTGLVRDYLRGRPNLRRVCLLVDARHGLKASDREVAGLLDEAAVSYVVVLTKADKLKPSLLDKRVAEVNREIVKFPAAHPALIATSAVKGAGIAELRAHVAALAAWR